ncbi:MAG: SusC/RagA family TonB-linked outer membrane protein [Bacteroidales bacterium]|nr:SusC/RagA family TonB-linked outer membrane protein [Bacteroidales bacterium]
MRKFTLFIAFLFFVGMQVLQAQDREITGTVTNPDDGQPIPGVQVVVKGTTVGTVTDLNGNYSLNVPPSAEILVFKYIGFQEQEVTIGDQTSINIELEESVTALDELVVTALGVTREKKALGYAVQDVGGDEITKAGETSVINSLSGKVSGLQVTSSGNLGGSSRILIRGASSITGENQPLFIVDGVPVDNANYSEANTNRGAGGYDYGSMASDINSYDVESVSILKGPAASALYGSRAANGVILITTKKGKVSTKDGKRGIGVTYNFGYTWETPAILPTYQNEYGGGYGFDTLWAQPGNDVWMDQYMPNGPHYTDIGDGYDLIAHYAVDESWGPKLEGQMYRPWYSWEPQIEEYFGSSVPWEAHPDNVKDFYQTGHTMTNNVALTGGSEAAFFRLSYTNMRQQGIMPNSELKKNILNFSGSAKLVKWLTAFTNINYVNSEATGRPKTGYDGDNVIQQFNQWGQRQWDQEIMEEYWQNPDGTQNTWNRTAYNNAFPKYTDNPYWTRHMNYQNDGRDRVYGNFGFTAEITDWLSFTGKYNLDYYTDRREERIAVGSNNISEYMEAIRTFTESNIEFLFQAKKNLTEDFSLEVDLGGNRRTNIYNRNQGSTNGGLPIPEFYSLSNTTDPISIIDLNTKYRVNSLYARASLGYKGMLYLDLTGRSDWSSTLPVEEDWFLGMSRPYFYPSVNLSYVFSETPGLESLDWLSLGKVRFGWAQVGNDTDPYRLYGTYRGKENFGINPVYTVPNALNNDKLDPERTTSWEVGGDFQFFKSRIGLDVTYYSMKTVDLIFPVTLSGATGYQSTIINAGEMTNKGIEVLLTGAPVRNDNFSWDITVNWAKNNNELVGLEGDIESLRLANAPFSVSVNAFVGEPYGTILGYDYTMVDGERLVGANGMYTRSDEIVPIGTVQPDWTGGIANSFTFKNWNLYFLFDMRQGGQVFYTSYMWGMYSGMLEETVEDNIREDGIVLEGVMEDPNNPGTYITNTTVLDAETYGLNHYYVNAMNVFDADFIKLRELSLSYTLPNKVLENTPFTRLRIAFIARNLWTFGTDIKHFDPEHVTNSGNVQGIEGAQVPSTKSYGINLNIGF